MNILVVILTPEQPLNFIRAVSNLTIAQALSVSYLTNNGNIVKGGRGGSWDYVTERLPHPTGQCLTRPLVMVIKADGYLASCFLFRNETADRPNIGYLSQGYQSIWFSETHRQQLLEVERGRCPSPCKAFRADAAAHQFMRGEAPFVNPEVFTHPYFI